MCYLNTAGSCQSPSFTPSNLHTFSSPSDIHSAERPLTAWQPTVYMDCPYRCVCCPGEYIIACSCCQVNLFNCQLKRLTWPTLLKGHDSAGPLHQVSCRSMIAWSTCETNTLAPGYFVAKNFGKYTRRPSQVTQILSLKLFGSQTS